MTQFIFIACLLFIIPLNAAETIETARTKKQTSITIPVYLPDGAPAKNLTVKISYRSMSHIRRRENQSAEITYITNDKGELSIPSSIYEHNMQNFYVFDIKGHALHIQAYYPLIELRLMPDQGFDGVLLDEKNQPIKNRKICVSQSIGIIWGQILIPKGINQTTTNDKGEFTMRQMILNSKEGTCLADVEFINEQSKIGLLNFRFKNTFYTPGHKKPAERIKVIKFVNEFIGKWSDNNSDQSMTITPTEILLQTSNSTVKADYYITKKAGNDYDLEVVIDSDKKDHFLGHNIHASRNYFSCKLIINDDQSIEITAHNNLEEIVTETETPALKFKRMK